MGNKIRLKSLRERLTIGKKRRRLARIERRAAKWLEEHKGVLERLGVRNGR